MSVQRHKIGTVNDFPEGEGTKVTLNGKSNIAVFNIDGEFYAILNRCLHRNYTLHGIDEEKGQGEINEEECSINCPWHGLEWNLETGKSEEIGKNIPTYDVEVEEEEVYIIR